MVPDMTARRPGLLTLSLLLALGTLAAGPAPAAANRGRQASRPAAAPRTGTPRTPRAGRPERHLMRQLAERRSPRAFQKTRVARWKLETILLAGHTAPSAFGARPYHFLVVSRHENPALYREVHGALVEGNKIWVQERPPVLIVASVRDSAKTGKPARYGAHDLGMAEAMMTVQAQELGVSMHPMAGFEPDAITKAAKLPGGLTPHTVIAVGYEGSPRSLPATMRSHEVERRGRAAHEGGRPPAENITFAPAERASRKRP